MEQARAARQLPGRGTARMARVEAAEGKREKVKVKS
jgi:hypothetical protein